VNVLNFVPRGSGRAIRAQLLMLVLLLAPLTADAQKTTPYTDPNNPSMTGTQTVTTAKLDNGNTLETTTAEATGVIGGKYVTETYTYSTEKDKDGNKVRYNRKLVRTTYDKKGGKQLARDGWTEKDTYNEAGGYTHVLDENTVNNETGETTDAHSESENDASGKTLKGHSTKTTRKPGEPANKEDEKYNPETGIWEQASLSVPQLEQTNAQPGNGANDETAYLPDVAGPSSQVVATFNDPDQSGPSGQVLVAFDDRSGHRTFFKALANAQHHVLFKILEGAVAVWLFKSFKGDGTPDDAAVKCAIGGNVPETQALPHVASNGPAITRASSAYERGGSGNGIVSVQTRGDDPLNSRVLIDGSESNIQTLAASDMSVKARLSDNAPLGRHQFAVQSGNKVSGSFPADVVTLRADPVAGGEPGTVSTLTVHCDGLPPADGGTMYFLVSGAARLEDGSQTTSAPVINGIAQVRIRGISAGAALVKFKLQARINGFWT
jgi:hypothetical protein